MTSTGIALFAYDRPSHVEGVLEGLEENEVEHLFVFIDGPRDEDDRPDVEAVRTVIDEVDWCSTTVTARERNIGLAESIVSGVERVLEDHERVVVVEDDCVPGPQFVKFMESNLDRYETDPRVMNVNGYSPPIAIPEDYPYDVYFTHRISSWGWGTWKSAWEQFEQEPMSLNEFERRSVDIKRVTRRAGRDLYRMMGKQLRGEVDSWAVWWAYAVAANDGICVNPIRSMIRNIGFDGSGTHTGADQDHRIDVGTRPVGSLAYPDDVFVDHRINARYNDHVGATRGQYVRRRLADVLDGAGLSWIYRTLSPW